MEEAFLTEVDRLLGVNGAWVSLRLIGIDMLLVMDDDIGVCICLVHTAVVLLSIVMGMMRIEMSRITVVRDVVVLSIRHITVVMVVQTGALNNSFSRVFSVHQVAWLASCAQNAHLVDLLDLRVGV